MKVCIITFQSAYNYGAILQNYALQKFIEDNFGNVAVLNYHNKNIDNSYKIQKINLLFRNPKAYISKLSKVIAFKRKNKKIDAFRKKYINLTKYYDSSNIAEANKEGDIFITGSDQVWNHLITGLDSTYYLSFVENKPTCSYAASFGVSEIQKEYISFYKENLTKINYISVREDSSIKLINKIIDRDAKLVTDPTLLINQKAWAKLATKPKIRKKYILVYKITKADKLISFAKLLSKKTGYQIIYIPNDLKNGIIGHTIFDAGPEEWLGYIKNAEYVVTNSFHGTVFSIIFEKEFFVECSTKLNKTTSRIEGLLSILRLKDRIIDSTDNIKIDCEIDYRPVKDKIEIIKNDSYEFLNKVIGGNKNEEK